MIGTSGWRTCIEETKLICSGFAADITQCLLKQVPKAVTAVSEQSNAVAGESVINFPAFVSVLLLMTYASVMCRRN
jgi:hypothetical protein